MPSDAFGLTRPWMLNALKASRLNRSLTVSVMAKTLYNEMSARWFAFSSAHRSTQFSGFWKN